MESLNYLYELLDHSTVSVLCYDYNSERLKDEFISNLNYLDLGEIDESTDFKSILRDIKISLITNDIDYLILDTSKINQVSDKSSTHDMLNRSKILKSSMEFIRQDIYNIITKRLNESEGLDFDDIMSHVGCDIDQRPYKLLVVSSTYKSIESNDIGNIVGGTSQIYMADLVFNIKNDEIKIVKNRLGPDTTVSIQKLRRQIHLDNLLGE